MADDAVGALPLPVYVIHWNAPQRCAETVSALLTSVGVRVSVTVVDNASSALPDLPREVTVDRQARNLGFAGAANVALAHATATGSELFAITNHDLVVTPQAIARAVEFARSDDRLGIVGLSGERTPDGSSWIAGSFMLLRAACVRDVGQFDELFGSYCEDVDYCHRAIACGWRIAAAPGAEGTEVGSMHPRRARVLTYANFVALAAKERRWGSVLRGLRGLARRAVIEPRGGWPEAFVLAWIQLLRLTLRAARRGIRAESGS